MTIVYVLIVVVVAGGAWVASRFLRDRQFAKLAKEAGADEAMAEDLQEEARRRTEADRQRQPLAVRGLGKRFAQLWARRGSRR